MWTGGLGAGPPPVPKRGRMVFAGLARRIAPDAGYRAGAEACQCDLVRPLPPYLSLASPRGRKPVHPIHPAQQAWLGREDSNLRNTGSKVPRLTAWPRPSKGSADSTLLSAAGRSAA